MEMAAARLNQKDNWPAISIRYIIKEIRISISGTNLQNCRYTSNTTTLNLLNLSMTS